MPRPHAVAFDIIGTTFSLEPLRGALEGAGVPGHALEALFAATLRDAFALAATDAFQPLRAVMGANLDALFRRHGVADGAAHQEAILGMMATLPPHPDAAPALAALARANAPALAVSNGGADATRSLLRNAGLDGMVSAVVSVDDVGLSKPRREVYQHAARSAGVEPGRLALVATHPWDIQGAKAAGLLTGFVARGQAFPPVMASPDVQGEDLVEVVEKLLRLA